MEYCAFVEPQQGGRYADIRAAAQAAERLGFTGFFRSDHYLASGTRLAEGTSDAWTTLAGLARDTRRIRLGTLVSSATYRLPGILAVQVANVDEMSDGRVELGLGTGWFEPEHTAYGIPFPEKRFGMLEEQLAIVSGLWETPHTGAFDFAGAHYALSGAPGLAPTTQHRIPLIVGGGGPRRTPELAARYATEYNIFRSPASAAGERFDVVRAACEEAGRDPATLRYSAAVQIWAGRDTAEIDRRAARIGRTAEALVADPGRVAGSVAQIVDEIAAYREVGADRVYLQFLDLVDVEHLEFVGSEILPQLP